MKVKQTLFSKQVKDLQSKQPTLPLFPISTKEFHLTCGPPNYLVVPTGLTIISPGGYTMTWTGTEWEYGEVDADA